MNVLPACISLHHVCGWYLWRPEESVRSSGKGVTEGYESLCGCWELNPDPLQGQQVL